MKNQQKNAILQLFRLGYGYAAYAYGYAAYAVGYAEYVRPGFSVDHKCETVTYNIYSDSTKFETMTGS